MKISELISKLSKCENQDAEIHIVCGSESPGANEDDIFDTTEFEVFSDHSDDGYQDLFILDKAIGMETKESTTDTRALADYLADYVNTEIERNNGVYVASDVVGWIGGGIEAFESTENVKIKIESEA